MGQECSGTYCIRYLLRIAVLSLTIPYLAIQISIDVIALIQ